MCIENNMKESSSSRVSTSDADQPINVVETKTLHHELSSGWTLWGHLPHDTDWSLKSYIKLYDFNTVEQTVSVTEMLPPKLVMN